MKIEDTTNNVHRTFGSLKMGDIFYYRGHVFMKTNHYTIDTNSVSLETGRITPFCDDDEVILLNAKLVIYEKENENETDNL